MAAATRVVPEIERAVKAPAPQGSGRDRFRQSREIAPRSGTERNRAQKPAQKPAASRQDSRLAGTLDVRLVLREGDGELVVALGVLQHVVDVLALVLRHVLAERP